MTEAWNGFAGLWWQWMSQMAWQAGLLILLVALADRLLRRRAWPQLRMALWAVVLIKLVLPPSLPSPLGLPSPDRFWQGPEAAPDSLSEPEARADVISGGADLSLQGWLMAFWMGGSASLAGMLLLRRRRILLEIRQGRSERRIPDWLHSEAEWAARALGLIKTPRLCLLDGLESAAAFGLLRPVVLLPAGALKVLPRRDWRNVLLHEMAHVRRGDLWLQALCQFLLTLYWFHPLLYLARRRIEHVRELCCDSLALARSPDGAKAYRRTLLLFARRLLAAPRAGRLPVTLLGQQAHILSRLEHLEEHARRTGRRHPLAATALAAAGAIIAVPMASPPPRSALLATLDPAADSASWATRKDPIAAQAWENLRQAAQGNNPGCLRLRYSALYLTLQQQKEGRNEVRTE